MRRAGNTSFAASISELITEGFFFQRSPALAGNECQVATRAGRKCLGQDRQNRNCHGEREAALLSFDRADTVFDVLTAEANSITAAKSGVQQYIQPDALTRSDRPTLSDRQQHVPLSMAGIRRLVCAGVFNFQRGIGLYHLGLCCPAENPPHGVKEMAGLNRRRGSSLASSHDRSGGDVGERFGAGCLNNVQKYIIAFPAGGEAIDSTRRSSHDSGQPAMPRCRARAPPFLCAGCLTMRLHIRL